MNCQVVTGTGSFIHVRSWEKAKKIRSKMSLKKGVKMSLSRPGSKVKYGNVLNVVGIKPQNKEQPLQATRGRRVMSLRRLSANGPKLNYNA